MALEVIANGVEWEPGTKTARLALLPPEVSAESIAITADIESAEGWRERRKPVEPDDLPSEPASDLEREPTSQPELDDEPVPVDLAEIDRELDAELDEAAEEVKADSRWEHPDMPGLDGLSLLARQVLEIVREVGEITAADIKDRVGVGLSDSSRKTATRALVDRGLVVFRGEGRGRRYKPVTPEMVLATIPKPVLDKPTMPDPEPAPLKVEGAGGERTDGYTLAGMPAEAAEVRRNGHGSDEGRVLDSVGFKPGWSITAHAARLTLHQDRVAAAMRKLEAEGEVRGEAKNGRVVWTQL